MSATDNLERLVGAYLDGELSATEAAEAERRIASEPEAARLFERLSALRETLRADRDTDVPPAGLAERISASFGPAPPTPEPARVVPIGRSVPPALRSAAARWGALAAGLLLGVLIGLALAWGVGGLGPQRGNTLADQLLANHIRAAMAQSPVDVASSDRHTVKPWFDGKLNFAPNVIDLADAGFPLLGGRVDIVDFQPAAALVYRYNGHLITVTELPGAAAPPAPSATRGFTVRTWQKGALAYVAVSDAAADELDRFVMLFQMAGE